MAHRGTSTGRASGSISSLLVALLFAGCGAPRPAVVPGAPLSLPYRALDLLIEAREDSCSICAKKHRRQAFEELGAWYPPGTILKSGGGRSFVKAQGAELELALSDYARKAPRLSFRCHDAARHLVGVAEADYSDSGLVRLLSDSPAGTVFSGEIELVAYAYGDGPTFLYSVERDHVEVECRLLELVIEAAMPPSPAPSGSTP